jgi:hypothetical protein
MNRLRVVRNTVKGKCEGRRGMETDIEGMGREADG